MDYTKEIEYWKDRETAYRSPLTLTDSNLDEVQIFDRLNWKFRDITERDRKQLIKVLGDVTENGKQITEEEYNEIINKEKKED